MFLACIRCAVYLGAALGTAYLAYRANRVFDENRYEQPRRRNEEPRRMECHLCHKLVEPSHEIYNNSCGCLFHKGCMSIIKDEGQLECPRCREPLNNRGGMPGNGRASHSRSSDGTIRAYQPRGAF